MSVEALFRGASLAVVRRNAADLGFTVALERSTEDSVRLAFEPDEGGRWFEVTVQEDGELHAIALSSTRGSYDADLATMVALAGDARLVGHNPTHEWEGLPD